MSTETRATHTPGRWFRDLATGDIVSDAEIVGNIICSPPVFGPESVEVYWPANANLIAAAPDGLAFAEHALPNLRWAVTKLQGNAGAWKDLIIECEAFIAAARGEA